MNCATSLLGSKVWLGPVEAEHLGLVKDWRNSDEVRRGMYRQPEATELSMQNWFARYQVDPDDVRFMIHAMDAPVGCCGLVGRRPMEQTAELAIFIGEPAARRQGFAEDALRTMLGWGFGEWGLRRVGLDVFPDNVGAVKLYRRLGFALEGVRCAAHFDVFKQEYVDVWVMGLLRGAWEVLA